MAEIVLTPLLQVVFEKVASRVLKEIAHRYGFNDEIQKLQRALRMIQAVLEDAEEQQATDKALKLWLTELKEVAYDADDLLEEFTLEALLQEHDSTFTQQNLETRSCHGNQPHSNLTSPSGLQLLVAFSIYLFLECRAPEERCKKDVIEDCLTSNVKNVDIGSRELESSPSH